MFYAHSTDGDTLLWQGLVEHLTGVASLAARNGETVGLKEAARLAGLLHDLGKFDPAFQKRLSGWDGRVDHSTAGAWAVRRLPGANREMAELIAYAIAGHHAGLPDAIGSSSLGERLAGFDPARLDASWREALPLPEGPLALEGFKPPGGLDRLGFRYAMLGRMLFSCLVDADYRDTEAFYAKTNGQAIDRARPALNTILPALRARFDRFMAEKSAGDGKINGLRTQILTAVRAGAERKPGFFTLTVPTGGGKTLASLGFALDHAAQHGHRRIICAIPFTSIIDQTAAVFRAVLEAEDEDEAIVLEHHSAIELPERVSSEQVEEAQSKRRLAMEDWAAPIIVTTNVQLFESLFAARPGRARKLHNIAGSIIILDEAQTLPRNLLIPAVWALRELVEVYGCSVVLCTATQPALDARMFPPILNHKTGRSRPHGLGLTLEGRELAPDPHKLAEDLSRVVIRHAGVMPDAALLGALAERTNGLVIVNSRRHALELFRAGQKAGLEGMVHLTTRQYAAHRRVILADVRARLKAGLPCRLIATSLIEAGVDVDFDRVWRAESGLDQIVQAAGRCNREGRRSPEDSVVTVFEAPDHKPHGDMKFLAQAMNRVREKHPDLSSLDALKAYFLEVYWKLGEEGLDIGAGPEKGATKQRITPQFSFSTATGLSLAYRSVASAFRMIEEGMEPVIIARDEEAKKLVEKLKHEQVPSGVIARGLQPYLVQVPPQKRNELIANGHVYFAEQTLRAKQFAVLREKSHYSDDVGLEWERAGELGDSIF